MMMETKSTNIIKTYDMYTHMFLILPSVNCTQGWRDLFFGWEQWIHNYTQTHRSLKELIKLWIFLLAFRLSAYFRSDC